jgi:hypothetical protein
MHAYEQCFTDYLIFQRFHSHLTFTLKLFQYAFGNINFPIDEKTMVQAFLEYNMTMKLTQDQQYQVAEQWFNYHFEYFICKSDLEWLQHANITHVRVLIPHWILGDDIRTEQP